MDNFFDLIAKRESCRDYSDKPVETEKLRKCIEAARLAPSACNSQPWSFTVVNNSERSPKVAKCLQGMGMNKFTDKCPAFIVVTEESATLSAKLGGKVKNQEYAQIDIGLATAHLCLAATELGLSTCIMGWFSEPNLKELLAIPKGKRIRLVISAGYAASDKLREKNRKSLEDIATFV
jgi:nitroreductase